MRVVIGLATAIVATVLLSPSSSLSAADVPAPAEQIVIHDIAEIAKDFRVPTPEEIARLGTFWPNVPEEENAAHWFELAAGRLTKEKPPDGSEMGVARPYDGNAEAFERWVEANRAALDVVREGMRRKAHWTPVVVLDPLKVAMFDIGYFGRFRALARMVADEGFLDELSDRPDEAAEKYIDCLRLGMKMRGERTLIEILAGTSVARGGLRSLDPLIAGGRLGEDTLRMILQECRLAEVGLYELLAISERESAFTKAAMEIYGDIPEVRKQDELLQRYRAAMTGVLQRRSFEELLRKDVQAEIENGELKEYKDAGMMAEWPFFPWLVELARANVFFRVTEIRAGIALYQKKHGGALPETLDALCPAILNSVPIDPFSGKPMRYERTEGGWKVWSAGGDNRDDGGNSHRTDYERWDDADAVFVSSMASNLDRKSRKRSAP